MKLLTKFGGLVAVAAMILAGASLLVSPTPVSAAADDICTGASGELFSTADGTVAATGTAVSQVASGSTSTLYAIVNDGTAGHIMQAAASQGTMNGAATGAAVAVDTTDANGCANASLVTGDDAVTTDVYAKFTYVAPTVATDTIVTVTLTLQGGVDTQFGSITVKASVTPDSLTLSAPTNSAIKATPVAADAGSTSDITLTLKEGSTALNGQTVTVITTLGLIETDGAGACLTDANDTLADGAQACTATTAGAGQYTVSLFGAGSTGTATVTAVKGSLSASKDVTLYGAASSATGTGPGTMQASSVAAANTQYLTMKVVDTSGNAVSGVVIGNPVVSGAAVPIAVDNTGVGPATGAVACSAGTNGKGECTIELTSSTTSSLGDHTVTVTVPGVTAKTVVVVKVVGVTASITSDAPASVAGSSQTEIIATGVDANGDNVGNGVTTTATIIEGNGGLLNVDATTTAGQQKFTFVAPSSAGTTTILVTMGTASQLITVSVGATAPTPGAGFGAALTTGVNLTTYGGGTVAQLGTDAADGGATSVSVTVEGAFIVYVVGAPAFVNQGFSDNFPDGVPAGTVVLVVVN